ncbi:MAG: OsmC family peroxiredoxin [Planctomycetaceae bacterium]|nr:OsmC family peroxiredoxin [Planctomycetaceae bacterium]
MSEHTAELLWERGDQDFLGKKFSRKHTWSFDGGAVVPGSAAPSSVPPPLSDPSAVDPEEAFVAALASCHMLWFLGLAAKAGYQIDSYRDRPVGVLEKDGSGRLAITRVTLRPEVVASGPKTLDAAAFAQLHEDAHGACFIAASIRSEVLLEPRLSRG